MLSGMRSVLPPVFILGGFVLATGWATERVVEDEEAEEDEEVEVEVEAEEAAIGARSDRGWVGIMFDAV